MARGLERNAECGMRNAECGMRNAECGKGGWGRFGGHRRDALCSFRRCRGERGLIGGGHERV